MKQKLPERRSACPISYALDFIGDRWTLIVVRDLILGHKRYFQDLLEGNEGIASNILASRLKLLESAGMVTRREDPDQARRVIYAPTDKALDLVPVIVELLNWGLKHDPKAAPPPELVRRLRQDREGFIADVRASHASAPGVSRAAARARAAPSRTPRRTSAR